MFMVITSNWFNIRKVKVKVNSVVSSSLRPHGLYNPENSPGQNMGSLSLLQGIFPTQGLNPDLPYCRQILYQLSHKGSTTTKFFSEIKFQSKLLLPVCGFSRGTTARSVSLSWGAKEVGSPCEWRGGARHCSRDPGIAPESLASPTLAGGSLTSAPPGR